MTTICFKLLSVLLTQLRRGIQVNVFKTLPDLGPRVCDVSDEKIGVDWVPKEVIVWLSVQTEQFVLMNVTGSRVIDLKGRFINMNTLFWNVEAKKFALETST